MILERIHPGLLNGRQLALAKRVAGSLTFLLTQCSRTAIYFAMTVSKRGDAADGGFALVVTLSLMVLLTVVAVGLLSLSAMGYGRGHRAC